MSIERHPLLPFVPEGAKLLMLGSFPPPRARWSMDFFYPNLQNDMWRIFGLLLRGDAMAYVDATARRFRQEEIECMLREVGVALYDTATAVRRLRGNASDNFLEIVEPTDVYALLKTLPQCKAVCTTGGKASEALAGLFHVDVPPVGGYVEFEFEGRALRHYRMPSSSRAYPMKLAEKAKRYAVMLRDVFGPEILSQNEEG